MALTATAPQVTELQLKTYDDLRAVPDDGNRYELVFGEILMSPAPKTKHQLVLSNLYELMSQFAKQNQLGRVMYAPVDVKFSPYNVVQPDLLYISRENRRKLGEDYVDGAPDIVVEALSPSNRMQDLVKKAALYAEYQVAEYWIVDSELEAISINRWEDGQYVEQKLTGGIARSTVLTGFKFRIRGIFVEPEWMKTSVPEAE